MQSTGIKLYVASRTIYYKKVCRPHVVAVLVAYVARYGRTVLYIDKHEAVVGGTL